MNYKEFINEATYLSYKYNRKRTPEIKPEEWRSVYSNIEQLERRYQADLQKGGDREEQQTVVVTIG